MKSFLALASLAAVMLAQGPPISNAPTIVPRPAGAQIKVPAGFSEGHVTRTILFDERAGKMYLTVGSSADLVTGDPDMRAAVHRYNPDGTGHEVVATGLRNTVGLRFYPGTTQLWATVEERNDATNVVVADFFTSLK